MRNRQVYSRLMKPKLKKPTEAYEQWISRKVPSNSPQIFCASEKSPDYLGRLRQKGKLILDLNQLKEA